MESWTYMLVMNVVQHFDPSGPNDPEIGFCQHCDQHWSWMLSQHSIVNFYPFVEFTPTPTPTLV